MIYHKKCDVCFYCQITQKHKSQTRCCSRLGRFQILSCQPIQIMQTRCKCIIISYIVILSITYTFCFVCSPLCLFLPVVVVLWLQKPPDSLLCVDCDWAWPLTSLALWNSIHGASVTLWPPAAFWFYWLKDSLCLTAKCRQSESRGQRSRLVEMRQWSMVSLLQHSHNTIILYAQWCTWEQEREKVSDRCEDLRKREDITVFYQNVFFSRIRLQRHNCEMGPSQLFSCP